MTKNIWHTKRGFDALILMGDELVLLIQAFEESVELARGERTTNPVDTNDQLWRELADHLTKKTKRPRRPATIRPGFPGYTPGIPRVSGRPIHNTPSETTRRTPSRPSWRSSTRRRDVTRSRGGRAGGRPGVRVAPEAGLT